ncbi:MAG: hypothetical protein U0165_15030 [Polyangiaceae bacterium]
MKTSRLCVLVSIPTLWLACGSPPPSSPTSANPTPSAAPATSSSGAAHASSASAPAASASASHEHFDDPNESSAPIVMAPLLPKNTPKAKFPKSTKGDKACWQEAELTGDHTKDYEGLLSKCGAPTGLLEYVKPAAGRVHHKHDVRDTFQVKLHGGLCYRIFAVSDASIADLDILITTTTNSIIGDDKVHGPVAIIHGDQPWCMDDDTEYQFHVEVDGPGAGGYLFGIWARPKK